MGKRVRHGRSWNGGARRALALARRGDTDPMACPTNAFSTWLKASGGMTRTVTTMFDTDAAAKYSSAVYARSRNSPTVRLLRWPTKALSVDAMPKRHRKLTSMGQPSAHIVAISWRIVGEPRAD